MSWVSAKPDLYLHFKFAGSSDAPDEVGQLHVEFSALAVRVFNEFYGFQCDVEVEFADGSIKAWVKPTGRTIAKILAAYVLARDGIDYFSKDIRWIQNQMREHIQSSHGYEQVVIDPATRSGTQPILATTRRQELPPRELTLLCTRNRVGAIGLIDTALQDFRDGRISDTECVERIVRYLAVIDSSPERAFFIQQFREYLDTRYRRLVGNASTRFPWEELQREIDALPPRKRWTLNRTDSQKE